MVGCQRQRLWWQHQQFHPEAGPLPRLERDGITVLAHETHFVPDRLLLWRQPAIEWRSATGKAAD